MTRILILYGTTDGQTATIARRLATMLHTYGAEADAVDVTRAKPRPVGYEAVIVAASVHTGVYQPDVRQWVHEYSPALSDMPTAFISVCLGVLQPDPAVQRDVRATIDRFLTSSGWRPAVVKSVAGAVLYTRYGWLKRWLMRRIVRKAGGGTDTSRDYEYTDWKDLERFAASFAALVASRVTPRTAASQYAQSA
jgi:menaquinone-dependent protoporphyrinogen oxidase